MLSSKLNWNYILFCTHGLAASLWFSLVSSTNKTDHHDITEILLKVALNTITLTLFYVWDPTTSCSQVFVVNLYISSQSFSFIPYRSFLLDEGFINHTQWLLYKYNLLMRVICEKYRLREEANIPSRFSGEGHLTVLETGIFRK